MYLRALVKQTESCTTHLADIVYQDPTQLGLCDTFDIDMRGVWLDPTNDGKIVVWCHPWPSDITDALVSDTNPGVTLTNSHIKLTALVLHYYILLADFPELIMLAPRSGSDNTPTVSWITQETYTVNPVVADLLRIRTIRSIQLFFKPLVF